MKKIMTCGTVVVLMVCLGGVAEGKTEPQTAKATTAAGTPFLISDGQPNEKLRADVLKLVSDAKAGKLKVPLQQFPQSTHRNNLSKGAKIAIGVSIAAVIVFAILWHTTGPGSD
jgi:hypothetical protein